MSLKKLELFGFKSFADRTEIIFEPGVTCVVGPNGCGKSNISDSVRWVLGERSAKLLRGSKMEDVIFSGTDFRKPLGFSEVHLTIDNSKKILPLEYDEVTLSRKIYRSGESEYYINKTLCRYKDIQDIILDTGIGSNSYSMIEQGRIDYILQADPDERRFLIEEAAGISKFKSKKEEALKKLERTEENLLRLGDIIAEVEKNIKYAERQAKRAEKYKEQFETLKTLEIKKALWELQNLESRKTELESKKSRLAGEQSELQRSFSEKDGACKESQAKIQHLESELSFGELKKIELTSQINSLRDKIYFNVERIGSLKNQWLEAENEILSGEERIKQFRSEIEKSEGEIALRQSELKERETNLKSVHSRLSEEQGKLSSLQQEIDEIIGKQLQNDLIRLESQNEKIRLESKIAALKARIEQRAQERQSLEHEMSGLEAEISRIKEKEILLSEQKSVLEETLGVVNENLRIKETEIESILSRMLKSEGRRKELAAQIEFLSGRGAGQDSGGIFRAFEERRRNASSKLFGKSWFLKEVFRVKPGNEQLNEMLFSVLSPDVLVLSLGETRELKEIASSSAAAPVTALLFGAKQASQAIPFDWKGIRVTPLSELLELNPGLDVSALEILAQIYTVSKSAEELLSMGVHEITRDKQILSRDGILIGPGPFLTFPKAKGRDFSAEKLKELAPEKELLEHQLSEYEAREKRLKQEKEAMTRDQSKVHDDLAKTRTELESESKLAQSLIENMKRIEQRLQSLAGDFVRSEKEIEETERLILEHGSKARAVEQEVSGLQTGLAAFEEKKKKQNNALEVIRLNQVREETEVSSLRERFGLLTSHLSQTRDGIQTETHRIQQKRKSITDGERAIKQLTEDNNNFSLEIDGLVKTQSQAEISINSVKEQLETQKSRHSELESEVQSVRETLEKLRDELHQAEFKAMESSYSRTSVVERIRQSYKIDLDGGTHSYTLAEEDNIEEITVQIEGLKERVESYGAVNLLAVDEYTELKTRYDFMVNQRNDLTNARDALLDAIRKINKTTKKLFEDTFQQVTVNFQEFFTILFDGGRAELTLLDEENPLESGIEIMVRPPGKKLQQISLLSGGEKALTAIALLFALFKIKPSPFCVLDEVDAPLDEANIDRFLTVLRSFLNQTQFIIITHNRKTISMGDALYGVTMEETGISKLVSVRVSRTEKSQHLLKTVEIEK